MLYKRCKCSIIAQKKHRFIFMRIFINGFMGSGKTNVGKQLAKELNYYFVDLDEFIEEKTFSKISLLFKQFGEKYFRELEKEYLQDLAVYENMVVACGGGTITDLESENWMNKNGTTIFLNTNFETIFKRLNQQSEIEKRPLLKEMEGIDFKKKLKSLFETRQENYSKAKIKIDNKKIETSVILIQQALQLD